jgi:AraC-like DNA-binding protein
VSCFWELASQGASHRVLPDGAMDVLFVIGEGAARVVGPMTRAVLVESSGLTSVVGVRFRPGAAIDLLGVTAHELRDVSAPVSDVWGASGRSLDARLADARDASTAIAAIEAELEARVATVRPLDRRVARAVATIRAMGGELPVAMVSARAGIGVRQLERLFQERVGYGPKAFARIVRLERATQAIRGGRASGAGVSWARVAIECGYTDQPHLVREFRALTGLTPAMYARAHAVSEIANRHPDAPLTVAP